jgi:glycogen debranching enzyme
VRNSPACRRQVEVIEIPGGQFVAKTIGLARKIAADWANRHIRGVFINKDTSWAIQIGSNGLSKTLSGVRDFAQDHLEAVVALPKLLQEAKLEGSRPDRAGDPNIKALHVFRQPLSIGDRDYSAKLTVKETNDGRYFYDHSLSQLEREPAGISMDDAKGSAPHGPQTGFPQVKMASSAQNVKETPDPKLAALKSDTQGNVFDAVRRAAFPEDDAFGRQLALAARAFVVRRGAGRTIIAGYPWFLDWGRDSLICARGLLAAGLTAEVRQILLTFAAFEKDGTLPNSINGHDLSNRDTSDAPLWFAVACEDLQDEGFFAKPADGRRTIREVLASIAGNYSQGTPNGIRMDTESGLIWSPGHFTWMDTNHPAGTPREGYPVEIQVLWIRLLRLLERIDDPSARSRWRAQADRALASFEKLFWLEDHGWYADVLLARPGTGAAGATPSDALRNNCLFAVSLGLVTGEKAQRCVAAAQKYLVVPGGLRTIAPLKVATPLPVWSGGHLLNDPANPYWPRCEGDEDTRRKPAYHNGTAWTWTFPSFCEALALAWNNSPAAVAAARSYLASAAALLDAGCLGQLPEIMDGDAPHAQRGCDAQAWGVTETLRVWKRLNSEGSQAK